MSSCCAWATTFTQMSLETRAATNQYYENLKLTLPDKACKLKEYSKSRHKNEFLHRSNPPKYKGGQDG